MKKFKIKSQLIIMMNLNQKVKNRLKNYQSKILIKFVLTFKILKSILIKVNNYKFLKKIIQFKIISKNNILIHMRNYKIILFKLLMVFGSKKKIHKKINLILLIWKVVNIKKVYKILLNQMPWNNYKKILKK